MLWFSRLFSLTGIYRVIPTRNLFGITDSLGVALSD
jgi:hypothetical protein